MDYDVFSTCRVSTRCQCNSSRCLIDADSSKWKASSTDVNFKIPSQDKSFGSLLSTARRWLQRLQVRIPSRTSSVHGISSVVHVWYIKR